MLAAAAALPLPPPALLAVRASPGRGRGVFATSAIARGTLIEVSPVLVFAAEEWQRHARHTLLAHYTFRWRPAGSFALALGVGSLFNHSARPSVGWTRRIELEGERGREGEGEGGGGGGGGAVAFTTLKDVAEGEELFISYGPQVWFDAGGAEGEARGDDAPLSSDDEDALALISDGVFQ
jgi:SET domain-containing protein